MEVTLGEFILILIIIMAGSGIALFTIAVFLIWAIEPCENSGIGRKFKDDA